MPLKMKKGVVIDGVDTTVLSREKLETFAINLKNELDREREERNFFQLERDKLRTFWNITREQLDEVKVVVRNKDHEVEITEEITDNQIKQIMQEMKHLQYETQTQIGVLKIESETKFKFIEEEHERQQQILLHDKRDLRRELKEKEDAVLLQMQQLKMKNSEKIREKHEQFVKEAKEMVALHDNKMKFQYEEMTLKNSMEMFEFEERKNVQIQKLLELHDAAFNEMKNYYNDITLNNLALISTLKETIEDLRKQSERHERMANEAIAQNKKLSEPLLQTRTELIEVNRKLENYERDKAQLQRARKRNTKLDKELSAIKWETECLIMRNDGLLNKHNKLDNKFEEAVFEMQNKIGLKNVLLEKQIAKLESKAEAREALLNEVMASCDKKPINTNMLIENILKNKNETIEHLRFQLRKICKAHDDLIVIYESKLLSFGIPKDELGFEPLKNEYNINYGSGPAGLSTKNK